MNCIECGAEFWVGSGAGVYCAVNCQMACNTRSRWAAGIHGAALMRRMCQLRVWRANHDTATPLDMLGAVAAVGEIIDDLGDDAAEEPRVLVLEVTAIAEEVDQWLNLNFDDRGALRRMRERALLRRENPADRQARIPDDDPGAARRRPRSSSAS